MIVGQGQHRTSIGIVKSNPTCTYEVIWGLQVPLRVVKVMAFGIMSSWAVKLPRFSQPLVHDNFID